MQDWPEKEALLAAVGEFLMNDLRPQLTDARLSFRALIAANLTQVVASELKVEDVHDAAELTRLRALMPEVEAAGSEDRSARRRAIAVLNRALAERLRQGALDPEALGRARAHLQATLRDKLSVNNPLFDLAPEIE